MKDLPSLRARLAIPPLPVYFICLVVFFAVVSVPLRRDFVHDDSFTIANGIILGSLFGAIMAGTVAIARFRLRRALGTALSPREQLSLNWSIEHGVLPQDMRLQKIFPHYVRYYIKLNRHSRIYIPIVFGVLTIVTVLLARHTGEHIWLLYSGLFVVFAYIGLHGVNRTLRSLERLIPRLQTTQQPRQVLNTQPRIIPSPIRSQII